MPPQTTTEKDQFVDTWEREYQTTLRVLRTFPEGKEEFRPAPKSRNARELVWILLMGEKVIEMAVVGELQFGSAPPPPPASIPDLITMYETSHRDIIGKVKAMPPTRFDATMKFPIGPGRMGDLRVGQVLWMTLMDHVHHRGQLSVYLRILGSTVPSIYGPTADEPWM